MEGRTIGVFGSEATLKSSFETSVAKKSEVEGMIVYTRSESGRRYSLLDDAGFPEKVQGYARIASLCDHAFYVLPSTGKIAAPDGELAVLLDSFRLPGRLVSIDGAATVESVTQLFKGLTVSGYPLDARSSRSSVIDLSSVVARPGMPGSGALVYVDRAFSVKGVGVVVLGFVLTGRVAVHDRLRLIPASGGKTAEVKGVQINDEDQESAERGIRVGLSLKGVELKDLEKTSWLDDGSFRLADKIEFGFEKCQYYKPAIEERSLHLQLPGEAALARFTKGAGGSYSAALASQAPVWEGMRVCVLDLNAKSLRVAGGGSCHA